ncbi:MAG: 4Fe-4S dicluster domain-containing protein [Dehalococcoidia bacterium]|jgi:nitrate reductase beta subunit|nr:4Fe-4S dicluster domain-containing protein [Dehalococcoidia bacterium]
MSKVYNWQIGREQEYPYDEAHPSQQFAFVFNINRCIGCQTCTMACKSTWTYSKGQEHMWWNNVETKPYGGYPQHWDVKLLQLLEEANPDSPGWDSLVPPVEEYPYGDMGPYGTFEGETIFEAKHPLRGADQSRVLGYLPTDEEWRAPNIYEDAATAENWKPDEYGKTASLPEHGAWFFYLQRICNHCTYPGCLASCPRGAIYKRPEDGVVLIDQARCRGYRKCVEACPYKKALYRPTTRVSEKCIACYPRLEGRDADITPDGEPIETRCMSACVGKIRMQGFLNIEPDGSWAEDPRNPLYFLIREEQVALPLYPQFGTEPNGYYIPPRWVPRPYLEQMFGPGVERAIERYVCPSRELLAVLQLFRAAQAIIHRFEIIEGPKIHEREVTLPSGQKKTLEIFNDTVIGYGPSGKEVVRMTVEEPTFERPAQHLNTI